MQASSHPGFGWVTEFTEGSDNKQTNAAMNLVLQPQTLPRHPPSSTLFPASFLCPAVASPPSSHHRNCASVPRPRRTPALAATRPSAATNSVPPRNGVYTVGDFMTRKEELHTVKPTTTVDKALEALVEYRITGFPVIDDDWKLVGLVSDYDLLALDSISGGGRSDTGLFPEVDSTWKTFNEIQRLLSKMNGKVVGDLMTPAPLVVRETTNLEDAARLLLETKYRRLPVVDGQGKLVGIITRGNVVRAALQIKRSSDMRA